MTTRVAIGRLDAITGGTDQFGLYVSGPDGSTIIDGTSDMFRVVATGNLFASAGPNGTPGAIDQVIVTLDLATGLTYPPAHMMFVDQGSNSVQPLPWENVTAAGEWTDRTTCSANLVATNQTRVGFTWSAQANLTGNSRTVRYYILEQVGI